MKNRGEGSERNTGGWGRVATKTQKKERAGLGGSMGRVPNQ